VVFDATERGFSAVKKHRWRQAGFKRTLAAFCEWTTEDIPEGFNNLPKGMRWYLCPKRRQIAVKLDEPVDWDWLAGLWHVLDAESCYMVAVVGDRVLPDSFLQHLWYTFLEAEVLAQNPGVPTKIQLQ
jgi:hypothetical protein